MDNLPSSAFNLYNSMVHQNAINTEQKKSINRVVWMVNNSPACTHGKHSRRPWFAVLSISGDDCL